jgi:hypothetical protein
VVGYTPGNADRRPFGAGRRRTHTGHTQSISRARPSSGCMLALCEVLLRTEDSITDFNCAGMNPRLLHRGTFGSPPRALCASADSSDRSAFAGRRSSLRRRSRSPSAPGPTRARMTPSGHRSLLRFMAHPVVQVKIISQTQILPRPRGAWSRGLRGVPGRKRTPGEAEGLPGRAVPQGRGGPARRRGPEARGAEPDAGKPTRWAGTTGRDVAILRGRS